jgi:hypothetical protein
MHPLSVTAVACAIALGACGGGLHGFGVPLGFSGRLFCKPNKATGAVELDQARHVRAVRPGEGELSCADGSRVVVDVRPASRVEIVLLKAPAANEEIYVYTRVYDADGNLLSSHSNQFEWSARNAEVRHGTCVVRTPGCVEDSSAVTVRARPPSATLEVHYLGARGTRTFAVSR